MQPGPGATGLEVLADAAAEEAGTSAVPDQVPAGTATTAAPREPPDASTVPSLNAAFAATGPEDRQQQLSAVMAQPAAGSYSLGHLHSSKDPRQPARQPPRDQAPQGRRRGSTFCRATHRS
jgi:hypothetical protein